jgi:hypothetical protein
VVRGNRASSVWFCGHAVALFILVLFTMVPAGRTRWFWIFGVPLAVSNVAGQIVLSRRSSR